MRFTKLTVAVPLLVVALAGAALAGASLAGAETLLHDLSRFLHPSARVTPLNASASYSLCFVPDGDSCQDLLVDAIDHARESLLIQAYSFTSTPIAAAVKRAKDRGVDVKVILDKSQVTQKYSSATYLRNAGIPVVIDTKPAIAHNKVMIFDDEAVFTGSFNFTKAAEQRNAENGILIRGDTQLVRAYADNWKTRYEASSPY